MTWGAEGARETRVDGGTHRLPRSQLFPDSLEDQDIGIDGHADGQHYPRDARQGQGGVEARHGREQDEKVEGQRHVGDEPGETVVDEHEDDHGDGGPRRGENASPDGVGAERGADRPLLENLHGSGERAGLEHDLEIARLLEGEAARDLRLARGNPLLDPGRRIHVAVEDNGHELADIVRGDLGEDFAPGRSQGEADIGLITLVEPYLGVGDVGPREHRLFLDDDRNATLLLGLGIDPPLVEELVGGR